MESNDFTDIYREIADIAGIEAAVTIHKLFKGQQIMFPQKLLRKEYVCKYIVENYNGNNIRELAHKFGYSERRVRQILNEMNHK